MPWTVLKLNVISASFPTFRMLRWLAPFVHCWAEKFRKINVWLGQHNTRRWSYLPAGGSIQMARIPKVKDPLLMTLMVLTSPPNLASYLMSETLNGGCTFTARSLCCMISSFSFSRFSSLSSRPFAAFIKDHVLNGGLLTLMHMHESLNTPVHTCTHTNTL